MSSSGAIPSGFSEALIRQQASAESFRRGQEYQHRGAVSSLVRRGNILQAEVEGSEPVPYQVRVTFDSDGVALAVCTCPFDWGGWCKHIVAGLLTWLADPEVVEERPTLDALLDELSQAQLQTILVGLAERDPSLVDTIERQIAVLRTASDRTGEAARGGSPETSPVDQHTVRRDVRAAIHSLDRMRASDAYWHAGAAVGEVGQVLEEVWAFIRAEQGQVALAVLEALTEEYIADWTTLDDSEGEVSAFFYKLAPAWTEALLTADLSPEERTDWVDKLDVWSAQIEDYGIDDVFDAAIQAVEQGWNGPWIEQAPPAPARAEQEPWGLGLPDVTAGLTVARLNVLERRGRLDEFLHLSDATGHSERHARMLVELDRVDEAVAYGQSHLDEAGDALSVAQALQGGGHGAAALEVAAHGLTLDGLKVALAEWLRDVALAAGRTDLALTAGLVAFREAPNLTIYQGVQELAGDGWPELREELLRDLRRQRLYDRRGQVEVYLHEGLIDDAIAAVEHGGDYRLIEHVAEAAVTCRPEWVIQTCRAQAESIMDQGRAQAYDHAVDWLTHARAAYQEQGALGEWDAYLAALIEQHRRKYKLVPMLKTLETGRR